MIQKKKFLIIVITLILAIHQDTFIKAGELEFSKLVEKVEGDAIELAREVERLYKNRCENFVECHKNNYHECVTSFPSQTCPGGEQMGDKRCGDDITCSRLWDYTVSRVSVPEEVADGLNYNPTDPEVIETVCFSRNLDRWFRNKHHKEKNYWKEQYGLETPPPYFGARNGFFRIYPAYRWPSCGQFDPRKRPWYIAASSGPKNILLVLDVSGSMGNEGKLEIMKDAAKRIVNTLGVGDRIAIVPFSSQPEHVIAMHGSHMYVVTKENKAVLIKNIDSLYADGSTNFYAAFAKAFEIFDATLVKELHVDCNSAILFLTDGAMTPRYDMSEQDVTDFIVNGIHKMEEKTGHSVFLFTYSISGKEADRIPYKLSCAVKKGVWSKLEDESQIIKSLTSYYQLFAFGLGDKKNENFTAWVEPYLYADGVSTGTTIAAPVYDRDKEPPLFLGVVGLDFRLAAIEIALGEDKGDITALERAVRRSTAKCPSLESLSLCELESYRRTGFAGNDALCSNNCTESDFVPIEPEQCKTVSDYPTDLWANIDEMGIPYEDKACCLVGETTASDKCPPGDASDNEDSNGVGIIIGIIVAGTAVVCGCCLHKDCLARAWIHDRCRDSISSLRLRRDVRTLPQQQQQVKPHPPQEPVATVVSVIPSLPGAMNPSYDECSDHFHDRET